MPHMLDIDQLRTFVAIADTGSFTRASEIVHKTQSAVSMQMKRLEERIGRPIFARDGRASKLNDDGERLLDFARRIVRLNGECVASFVDNDLVGRVRLGLPDDYADRYLPEILATFSRSNPRAEVTVVCEPTPMLVDRIRQGDLDLAIITHVDGQSTSEVVRVEQLLWVGSTRHGVHDENPVPLALGRHTCTWRSTATDLLSQAGRAFRIAYVSWNSTACRARPFAAGLAVSVLPESADEAGHAHSGEAATDFRRCRPARSVSCAMRGIRAVRPCGCVGRPDPQQSRQSRDRDRLLANSRLPSRGRRPRQQRRV